MNPEKWVFNLLLPFLCFKFCTSIDILTPTQSIEDGDVLVSSGETFALGFFSPGNSSRRSAEVWNLRDTSGGCIKMREELSMCGNGEGFVKVANAQIPDTSKARVWMSLSMHECKDKCMRNCSCLAYTNAAEEGAMAVCVTWYKILMDVRRYVKRFPVQYGGLDLYVRVDAVELGMSLCAEF
ncbi:hypothetical protein RHGRI_031813 [Rhododendron griersonianum]|uniref:Apple domain-containing protein n=1 Tax=Rhododendron griersonianum TaxID=479676 RepID=A0AAV6IBS1_9ERIC|nr:hypothetical protein RHGRI_031813 [Rhododendron griersonianum]